MNRKAFHALVGILLVAWLVSASVFTVKETELAIKEDRADDFDRLAKELQQALHPIAEKMYQKAGQPGAAQPEAGGAKEGEVVDADFEVKK